MTNNTREFANRFFIGVGLLYAFYHLCYTLNVIFINISVCAISLLTQKELYSMSGEQMPYTNYIVTAASLGTTIILNNVASLPFIKIIYTICVPHTNFHSFCKHMFVYFYTIDMAAYIILYFTSYQREAFGLIITIAAFDTGSYFIGKAFGKTPFSKSTPNKTMEGVIGGSIVSVVFFKALMNLPNYYGILIIMTSLLGDKFESFIKRSFQCKDSGKALGAHGGILDRMDSYIFTIPVVFIVSKGL